MIIWGGVTSSDGSVATDSMVSEANIYDTTAGSWSVRQYQNGQIFTRRGHTAVWTGTQLIIWGGAGTYLLGFTNRLKDGAILTP